MQSKKDKAQYDMKYQRTHMKRVTLWFNIEKVARVRPMLRGDRKGKFVCS